MTHDTKLDDLLRALDPLSEELHQENARHRGEVWQKVAHEAPKLPRAGRRRRIGAVSLATVGAVVALVVGLLPGTTPLSATAATLHRAALADAGAANLPALSTGQFYYQDNQVAVVCSLNALGSDININYISSGSMQSWASPDAAGRIVLTPSALNQDGSHFATLADQAQWVAQGKPFVPCALENGSNSGNVNGRTFSFEGFGFALGYGFIVRPVKGQQFQPGFQIGGGQSISSTEGPGVTTLPTDVGQIASMLANGEINWDGSVSSTPQVCPAGGPLATVTGCDSSQQLALIEWLLQLPEASAKFGSVLYGVLSQMPGATVTANTTDHFGNAGTTVTVPTSVPPSGGLGTPTPGEFQVVLNPSSGVMLSSTLLGRVASNGTTGATYSLEGAMNYGPINVVNGIGSQSNAMK